LSATQRFGLNGVAVEVALGARQKFVSPGVTAPVLEEASLDVERHDVVFGARIR
jgi:hypothetical protein